VSLNIKTCRIKVEDVISREAFEDFGAVKVAE
jgi:hypothetical protein